MFARYVMIAGTILLVGGCASKAKTDAPLNEFDPNGVGLGNADSVYVDETAPVPGSQADLVINVGDRIFFDTDSSDLTVNARQTLENQAAWLAQYTNVGVVIEGHADERGTREYNLALGARRANAVQNYLVALGVNPSRVTTLSYGKERPAVPGSNENAWAQNRRSVTKVR